MLIRYRLFPIRRASHAILSGILVLCCIVASWLALLPTPAAAIDCIFRNPLVTRGQDPSVVYQGGYYYLVQSTSGAITIRKAANLTEIGSVEETTVWRPPTGQTYSTDVWAPELEYIGNTWYIYFAADDNNNNARHRIYVLQADTANPQGSWTFKGSPFSTALDADKWAIDPNVFTYRGQLFMVWSGWPTALGDFPQNLYLAPMSDPLTVSGPRHLIAEATEPWETDVRAIEEGPEAFIHNDQLSIVYSADASWTPAYKLGLLKLTGSDPLSDKSWTKVGPVLVGNSDHPNPVYGAGHNSMPVSSPDGAQNWLVFASKTRAADGWDDRAIRMQPFTWSKDNTPDFGQVVTTDAALPAPSGQPCGLVNSWDMPGAAVSFNGRSDFIQLDKHLINTTVSFSISAWVQLDRTDAAFSIVSQDGGITSGFNLHYSAKLDHKFAFSMSDGLGKNIVNALSTFSPSVGNWYHLVGVRDVSHDQLRLYINGILQSTAVYSLNWDARSNTIIGAAKQATQRSEYFSGQLKEIRFYNGVLTSSEIQAIYEITGHTRVL